MKICFLIWNTKRCGGNKVIFEYANGLFLKGHKVQILSVINSAVDWFDLKVELHSLTPLRFIKVNPDALIATFWLTAYLALILPAVKKFYLVLGWEPAYYKNPLLGLLVLLTIKFPFQFLTISKFLKDKITSFNSNCKVSVVPVGLEESFFDTDRTERDNSSERRILSVVSSYQRYKGLDMLVNMIKQMKRENLSIFRFVLVSFEKNKYDDCFDEFVSRATQKELIHEYKKADLFLAVARVEGFFLPALEAMACGCPVIMNDSGGVREYARNNFNCLIVKNPDEIVGRKLVNKLLEDSKLRDKLITNGLLTARKFSWDNIILRLEQILTS